MEQDGVLFPPWMQRAPFEEASAKVPGVLPLALPEKTKACNASLLLQGYMPMGAPTPPGASAPMHMPFQLLKIREAEEKGAGSGAMDHCWFG